MMAYTGSRSLINLKALDSPFSAERPCLGSWITASLCLLTLACAPSQPQPQVVSSAAVVSASQAVNPCYLGATYLTVSAPDPDAPEVLDTVITQTWFGEDGIYSEVTTVDDDRTTFSLRRDDSGHYSSLSVRIVPGAGYDLIGLTGFDLNIANGIARTNILSVNGDAPTLEAAVVPGTLPYFHRSPFFLDLILREAQRRPGAAIPLFWVGVQPYYIEDARVERVGEDTVRVVTDFFDLAMAVDSSGLLREVRLPGQTHTTITRLSCNAPGDTPTGER